MSGLRNLFSGWNTLKYFMSKTFCNWNWVGDFREQFQKHVVVLTSSLYILSNFTPGVLQKHMWISSIRQSVKIVTFLDIENLLWLHWFWIILLNNLKRSILQSKHYTWLSMFLRHFPKLENDWRREVDPKILSDFILLIDSL